MLHVDGSTLDIHFDSTLCPALESTQKRSYLFLQGVMEWRDVDLWLRLLFFDKLKWCRFVHVHVTSSKFPPSAASLLLCCTRLGFNFEFFMVKRMLHDYVIIDWSTPILWYWYHTGPGPQLLWCVEQTSQLHIVSALRAQHYTEASWWASGVECLSPAHLCRLVSEHSHEDKCQIRTGLQCECMFLDPNARLKDFWMHIFVLYRNLVEYIPHENSDQPHCCASVVKGNKWGTLRHIKVQLQMLLQQSNHITAFSLKETVVPSTATIQWWQSLVNSESTFFQQKLVTADLWLPEVSSHSRTRRRGLILAGEVCREHYCDEWFTKCKTSLFSFWSLV